MVFFRSGYNFLVVKCEDGRSDQRRFSRKTEVYFGAGCYLMVEETWCDTGQRLTLCRAQVCVSQCLVSAQGQSHECSVFLSIVLSVNLI